MKTFLISSMLMLLMTGVPAEAQLITKGDEKREINHRELPAEARNYIVDKFPGAEILKTYITVKGEETTGYLVELKSSGNQHLVYFNKEGLPNSKKQ